ncbi:MAG: hypothetical protein IJE84_04630 [Clostridia bacterium]|nr:hypothetical protein [Clostridia bacterium]
MRICRDPYIKQNGPAVIALGCFDGVHTAHAAVIRRAVSRARELGVSAAVWCFSEPPKNAYLSTPVPLVTTFEEKARQIRRLGVDLLITPFFTPEIAALTPEQFVRELLCECAGAVHLVCGKNYSFGAGGRGDIALLSELCQPLGIEVTVIEDVRVDGVAVSSTLVREAVSAGQCEYAARLLGRDFCISAVRGKDGGYLVPSKYLCVPEGEYAAELLVGVRKRQTAARFTSGEGGMRVRVECGCEAPEIRLTLRSGRLTSTRK